MTRQLDDAALRERGLPMPDDDADKEGRGDVLVVAGSREVPGAARLAATAALRAGAGRLLLAVPQSIALAMGLAVPEARVIALPETADGGLSEDGLRLLEPVAGRMDGVVAGPGLMDEPATVRFVRGLLDRFDAPFVLDALALAAGPKAARANVVVTPHAGEMAHLTGLAKDAIQARPGHEAREASDRWGVGVVLKGATTWLAFPGEADWRHDDGDVGLATSGSGDTLAGILGGLLARGVPPFDAALWAVRLHALAGERLVRRHGRLGYLARELGDEVPAAMHRLCSAGEAQAGGAPGSGDPSASSSA